MPKVGAERKNAPGAGRPTALTPETRDIIVQALRIGAYHETAAGAAGVHVTTLRDWLRRGMRERRRLSRHPDAEPLESEKVYANFSHACQKATCDSELGDLATIARASQKQWQAAAWRLERKFPDRYGRRDRHEVTGAQGGPLRVLTEVVFAGVRDDADDQE